MLKNCPSKTHESPSKQNIVTVRKIHMVNKFTVSRVKAVQVNKENDKINNMHNNEGLAILAIKICLYEHECTNNNKTYNILPLLHHVIHLSVCQL
jgi:hypothetical protein